MLATLEVRPNTGQLTIGVGLPLGNLQISGYPFPLSQARLLAAFDGRLCNDAICFTITEIHVLDVIHIVIPAYSKAGTGVTSSLPKQITCKVYGA